MTKTKRAAAASGGADDEAFHRHYAAIWGEERWRQTLYPALVQPTRHACMLNRYAPLHLSRAAVNEDGDDNDQRDGSAVTLPLSLPHPSGDKDNDDSFPPMLFVRQRGTDASSIPFPAPTMSGQTRCTHWNLDAASLLVASVLDVQPGDNVLDLCAAPGGKSIALAQRLWPHYYPNPHPSTTQPQPQQQQARRNGQLHANEFDAARHKRLAENLSSYLPRPLFEREQIRVLRVDGSRVDAANALRVRTANGTVDYDKVLVDAPCSSERHIIHASARVVAAANDTSHWRPGSSSKRLATTQTALLRTGLRAARLGASVLYATCSLAPAENDEVVARVLAQLEKERAKGAVSWRVRVGFCAGAGDEAFESQLVEQWAERTAYGWIVLPDHPSGAGWGPLYFALLTKLADGA